MCKFNKNKPQLRLIFVTLEFKDDIWSLSAKVLNFFDINCKLKVQLKEEKGGSTMKFERKNKKKLSDVIIKIAEKSAYKTCDSACVWWKYQPKVPTALKKTNDR